MKDSFYTTDAWRILRRKVLRIYGEECMNCGLSPNETGKSPHVDHIKPRSLYSHLKLEIKNLQVLCEECNTKLKSTNVVDYRTSHHFILLEKFLKNKSVKPITNTVVVMEDTEESDEVLCNRSLSAFKNFRGTKKKKKKAYNKLIRDFGEEMVYDLARRMI